jgi:3-oxoacyl-(acyl-carrier-protein) synthase
VLETAENAAARGVPAIACIAGCGNSCDAYHASAPAPDGAGLFRAMKRALDTSGFHLRDIGYINAHGTGTIENDAAEAKAICRLFGPSVPHVSSTKRFFGHSLGAAGAIEAIVCIQALQHRRLPANLGLREVAAEVGFVPLREMTPVETRAAMSNSLGFGGNNFSMVVCLPENARG